MVESPFATAAQRDGAEEIDRLKISRGNLLGELLLPADRDAWNALTNTGAWRTTLMPEQPTALEKDLYFQLRDDKNMQNVYLYQLVTNARPHNTVPIPSWFACKVRWPPIGAGQMTGPVYDPRRFHDTSRFVPQTYSDWDYSSIIKTNRAPECDSFERIGLGDLIDPNTGNYQKPILQLFDQLNRDDNASALFRAFVTMKLISPWPISARTNGDMQWCPASASAAPPGAQGPRGAGLEERRLGWVRVSRARNMKLRSKNISERARSMFHWKNRRNSCSIRSRN